MRRAAWCALVAASLLVLLNWKDEGDSAPRMAAVGEISAETLLRLEFGGEKLVEEPLTDREASFAAEFPGKIARFTVGGKVVILRETDRATHRVHGAATCLAASGWTILPLPAERTASGEWTRFRAEKGGEALFVREQIRSADGSTFPDVPAWFWSALLGRTRGPWLIATIVHRRLAPAEEKDGIMCAVGMKEEEPHEEV